MLPVATVSTRGFELSRENVYLVVLLGERFVRLVLVAHVCSRIERRLLLLGVSQDTLADASLKVNDARP